MPRQREPVAPMDALHLVLGSYAHGEFDPVKLGIGVGQVTEDVVE